MKSWLEPKECSDFQCVLFLLKVLQKVIAKLLDGVTWNQITSTAMHVVYSEPNTALLRVNNDTVDNGISINLILYFSAADSDVDPRILWYMYFRFDLIMSPVVCTCIFQVEPRD
jgi:hypothetical protein